MKIKIFIFILLTMLEFLIWNWSPIVGFILSIVPQLWFSFILVDYYKKEFNNEKIEIDKVYLARVFQGGLEFFSLIVFFNLINFVILVTSINLNLSISGFYSINLYLSIFNSILFLLVDIFFIKIRPIFGNIVPLALERNINNPLKLLEVSIKENKKSKDFLYKGYFKVFLAYNLFNILNLSFVFLFLIQSENIALTWLILKIILISLDIYLLRFDLKYYKGLQKEKSAL